MTVVLYSAAFILLVAASLFAFVYLAPVQAIKTALDATRRQAGLVRKEITLPNGLCYAYLEGGQGEPLLLLHGFGGNKDTFTRVARFLVKRYRLIIPDIIGFGESSHPNADYSPFTQVERIRDLSRALNLERLHLGGNSMGGQIALLYAALYPTEVASLWLLSPAVSGNSVNPELLKVISESGRNPLIARNVQEFMEVMALGMRKPPFIPGPMLKVLAQERIQNAELEARIFRQIVEAPVEDKITGLKTPALIMFGKQDRVITLETTNDLGRRLANSRVVFIPNAGHVPMFEKSRQCTAAYLVFRESIQEG